MSVNLYKVEGVNAYAGTVLWFASAADNAKAINADAWFWMNRRFTSYPNYYGWSSISTYYSTSQTFAFMSTYPSLYGRSSIVTNGDTTHTNLLDAGKFYNPNGGSPQYFNQAVSVSSYTRAFTASAGGTVAVTGYGYGAIGTCEAIPTVTNPAMHEFVEWRNVSDDSAVVPAAGLTVDSATKKITVLSTYAADVAVYAYFRAKSVALNASVSGSGAMVLRVDGTTQGSLTGIYLDRSAVHTLRLTATPSYGYQFYRWGITTSAGGGTPTTNYYTSADYTFYSETAGADTITVVGYFVTRPTAAVSVSKANPTFGTISATLPDASVLNEVNNTLVFDAYEGYDYVLRAAVSAPASYYFLGWFTSATASDGTLVSSSAEYTRTISSGDVSSGVTLYAVFREKADVTVTAKVLLDGTVEAVNRDGNLIAPVTGGTLKAGDNSFAVTINAGHYWAKPAITVTELLIGSSTAYNTISYPASAYTLDADNRVVLNLSPIQAWTTGQTAIAFEVAADFPATPVGATVMEGANAGTYPWMYEVAFTSWAGRADTPDPMAPLYGDTGTVTIIPVNSDNLRLARVTVKYGEVVALDQETTGDDENEFEFAATVTGPITITVQLKCEISFIGGSSYLPETCDFYVNGAVATASGDIRGPVAVAVGIPCAIDYVYPGTADVFDGWAFTGFAPYLDGSGEMVSAKLRSPDHPVAYTPNGDTTVKPHFVTADTDPYIAVQFFNATANAVFIPGGVNPTVLVGGGATALRDDMKVQVGALAGGNFHDAFAADGTTAFYLFPPLGTITLTATGTATLPFLRWEKAAIKKGNGEAVDCEIDAWSAIDPSANPASFSVIVSCGYRAVFGAYQPQSNTAAFRTSAMRSMGALAVTGYNQVTRADGSVTASTGYGSPATWAASANVGYVFAGWYSLSGETYTLVSANAEYTVEQDAIARTLYASFEQDTTRLYEMEGSVTPKTMEWRSKRLELARPTSFSACRCDADGYPVALQVHAFSSPSSAGAADEGIVECADQNARRLPTVRKERFFEFSLETQSPVVGMSFSTTMQGLS